MKKIVFIALTLAFLSNTANVYANMFDEKNSLMNTNQTNFNTYDKNNFNTGNVNTGIENNTIDNTINNAVPNANGETIGTQQGVVNSTTDNLTNENETIPMSENQNINTNTDNTRDAVTNNTNNTSDTGISNTDLNINTGADMSNMNNSGTDFANNTNYRTFRGNVQSVDQNGNQRYVTLANQFGQNIRFSLGDNTFLTQVDDIAYNNDLVVVYDPNEVSGSDSFQFNALAVTNDISGSEVALSSFDDEYISENRDISLDINDNTSVLSSDGSDYNGDFENRNLLVFYNNSNNANDVNTRKIVVYNNQMDKTLDDNILSKNAAAVTPEEFRNSLNENDRNKFNFASGISKLVVNLQPLTIADTFQTENGVTMVPLEAVLRITGKNMYYDRATQQVGIENAFHFMLGHPSVTVNGVTHLLDANAVEHNGMVFVPLDFFSKALNMVAYERNGNVVISEL